MSDPIRILDPDFDRAVGLIDAGEAQRLANLVDARPSLLIETADLGGMSIGEYFADPRLIWFVAENPIRTGTLPSNISEVTQSLIDASKKHQIDDLVEQLNYTLALVASGLVARKCNVQQPLIETLIRGGADPNSGVQAALGHREIDACLTLLDCGADMTLEVAAGLGKLAEVEGLAAAASTDARQRALTLAAINGQADCVALLIDHGADPNQFNPKDLHMHSTPLHQAVFVGDARTVQVLIDRGADQTVKDTIYNSTAKQWADHQGHIELARMLE